MSLQLHASPQITQILKVGILTKTQRQKISRFLHASLIPRDPQPNEKYQAVIPPSTQPLKVQDLSTVEASGPRVSVRSKIPTPLQPLLSELSISLLLANIF